MSSLSVFLFGAPRIERDGAAVAVERRKSLALLAYLAVTRQPHGRDALTTLLWPELDGAHARGQLRTALADLQRAIGPGWVETEGDQVMLRAAPGLGVDVSRFHELLAQVSAHSHPPHRLCDACLAALSEAVDLYAADFLAGFTLEDAPEFDAWQTFQTESLRLELGGALEKLAAGLAGRQGYDLAIARARRRLALDPLHEPAQRLLMQLHAWAGDRAAALRQYQDCARDLQQELGIEPEPETTALLEAIRSGAAGQLAPTLPLSCASTPMHNLPPDPTPFIGREQELIQIAERLSDPACRLLTILGPGGVGKTRLAIQAARSQTDVFAHGVFFVDLTPIASAAQLAETILRTLQLPSQGGTAPDRQILAHLTNKQMLLVLDNYEHLLTGPEPDRRDGYGLVTELLNAALRIKLLVTSRARLDVRAEWLVPLEGLETPGELAHEATKESRRGAGEEREALRTRSEAPAPSRASRFVGSAALRDFVVQPATLERYSATALFLSCIRRVQPGFPVTTGDARHIVKICRLLDGMPLAIELAAAWIRTLSLERIERELERGLDLLATTLRDVPPRHRSMTATFEYSWRLLTASERSLLRELSVFRGGFTRDAAHAVTGAAPADLVGLADASWLRLGRSGRYQIHELTRQYCAEKLETEHARERGEAPDQVRDRYASYFQAFAQATRCGWGRPVTIGEQLAPEIDNLLAARDWHVNHVNLDAANELTRMFAWYGYRMGWYASMAPSLERSIRQLERQADEARGHPRHQERDLLLGCLHQSLADCYLMMIAGERAVPHLRRAEVYLEQGPPDDPRWREARWLYRRTLAFAEEFQGEFTASAQLWETLRSELSDPSLRLYPYDAERKLRSCAETYWGQAGGAWRMGHYAVAQRLSEESLAICAQCDWGWGQGPARRSLTYALLGIGAYQEAEAQARAALNAVRAAGDRPFTAEFYNVLGVVHSTRGNYELAGTCYRRSLAIARTIAHHSAINHSLRGLAEIALAQGLPVAARQLYEQSLAGFERLGASWPMGPAFAQVGLGQVALAMQDLAEARRRFKRVLASGRCTAEQLAQGIAGMAGIWLAEGQTASAADLLAFVQAWPSSPHAVRERASGLLATLESDLPAKEFAVAVARGRARRLEEVVAELTARDGAECPATHE